MQYTCKVMELELGDKIIGVGASTIGKSVDNRIKEHG
jgi:hypothetical protein